jgi:hypothetical protein
MTVTAQQVDEFVGDGWYAVYWGETKVLEAPFGTIEAVTQKKFEFNPYETDGSPIFIIVRVGDQYFQKEGVHASWVGTDFDGECVEVEPVEVPLTFYRRKE